MVEEFIDYYYGAAAPYVQKYFDLCHKQIERDDVWGLYYGEDHSMYSDDFMPKATKLMSKARNAVKNESEELKYRVDLVDLQVKFLHLMREPQAAVADGTYDYFNDFIRRHKISVSEWRRGPEGWIEFYDKEILKR